jgi:hypothetical protein
LCNQSGLPLIDASEYKCAEGQSDPRLSSSVVRALGIYFGTVGGPGFKSQLSLFVFQWLMQECDTRQRDRLSLFGRDKCVTSTLARTTFPDQYAKHCNESNREYMQIDSYDDRFTSVDSRAQSQSPLFSRSPLYRLRSASRSSTRSTHKRSTMRPSQSGSSLSTL